MADEQKNTECDIHLKPEYIAEQLNREKTELGMNSWHGTKYDPQP